MNKTKFEKEREALKRRTIKKWKKLGLLEGLDESKINNIFILHENQLKYIKDKE